MNIMTNSFGLLKLLIVIPLIFSGAYSMAQYLEPTTKTNINQISPLFEENIENYQGWQEAIDRKRELAIEASGNNQALGEESSSPKAKSEIDRLSNISANELEGQGRQERAARPWVDDFFVDYSKVGNQQHQSDAELIANSSGNLLNKLTTVLRNLGVDCKEVKGNKEVEPQYYLELQREKMRDDTVYDQFFCEQLRNSYSCRKQLIMRCKTQGYQWGVSEVRTFTYNWQNIPDSWKELTIIGGPMSYCRWYTMRNTPTIMTEVRSDIARNIMATLEQIEPCLEIPQIRLRTGWAEDGWLSRNWEVKDQVNIDYHFRTGNPICLEWYEEWNEVCELN